MVLAQKTFDLFELCLIEVLYKKSIDSNDNRNSYRILLNRNNALRWVNEWFHYLQQARSMIKFFRTPYLIVEFE